MIQANELRLNNWAIHPASCTEIQLTEIDIIQIMERSQDGLNQNYEPIPLTPEWLTRAGIKTDEFGFKLFPVIDRLSLHGRWVTKNILGDKLDTPFLRMDCTNTDIYFVHQMQNYFFATTGTELEFK